MSDVAAAECVRCRKPLSLCVCDGVVPLAAATRLLVLQHPQEQDQMLGTARLTLLHFPEAVLRIGLSWPSLVAALGRKAEPRDWAVLYLGSARARSLAAQRDIVVLDRKGAALADQDGALADIAGIVVLDGSWAQAKALWWRNPWLLKCQRVVLGPARPSRYGALRREPHGDALATLEAVALLMARVERRPEIEAALLAAFDRLLEKYRQQHPARPATPQRRRGARRGAAGRR